jgi:hypothetical protein
MIFTGRYWSSTAGLWETIPRLADASLSLYMFTTAMRDFSSGDKSPVQLVKMHSIGCG